VITLAAAERDAVIVACAISAGVHAALAPEHFGESAALGAGFLASAAALAAIAIALTRRVSPLALGLASVAFAGLLAGYGLAITVGLPLLHPEPEPVEGIAVGTKVVEALGLVAALDLLHRGRAPVSAAFSSKGVPA
jgi:hypothetical protein